MESLTLTIPQMGEGLQEAQIVRFYKTAGDSVERDEPIYQMETDKALVDVETECAGTLASWLCREGDMLPIGAAVATLVPAVSAGAGAARPGAVLGEGYLLKSRPSWRGAVVTGDSLPRAAAPAVPAVPVLAAPSLPAPASNGVERSAPKNARLLEISPRQRTLWNRMKHGAAMTVPALVRSTLDYKVVKTALKKAQTHSPVLKLTAFEFFAYLVAQAARKHPKFRVTIGGNEALYIHDGLNLGIAVAMKDDELATAVVKDADKLSLDQFTAEFRKAVRTARRGQDQADDTVQLLLSSLGSYNVHDATPVIVPPAIATLFLGSPFVLGSAETMTLSLTFDHRAINGVGAGAFLKEVTGLLASGFP
jgi:pyruvate/2-oxoglutarate dehydrogenase complex dihydrolipoamide acyltransferase (E2) component